MKLFDKLFNKTNKEEVKSAEERKYDSLMEAFDAARKEYRLAEQNYANATMDYIDTAHFEMTAKLEKMDVLLKEIKICEAKIKAEKAQDEKSIVCTN